MQQCRAGEIFWSQEMYEEKAISKDGLNQLHSSTLQKIRKQKMVLQRQKVEKQIKNIVPAPDCYWWWVSMVERGGNVTCLGTQAYNRG